MWVRGAWGVGEGCVGWGGRVEEWVGYACGVHGLREVWVRGWVRGWAVQRAGGARLGHRTVEIARSTHRIEAVHLWLG